MTTNYNNKPFSWRRFLATAILTAAVGCGIEYHVMGNPSQPAVPVSSGRITPAILDNKRQNVTRSLDDKTDEDDEDELKQPETAQTSTPAPIQNVQLVRKSRISPYDEITEANAKRYGIDFYLLLGQQMQESRFNPKARSKLGARGLAQFMPDTAEELGYSPDDLFIPEKAIEAQARYMRNIYHQPLIRDAPEQERIKLTIASYNAGYGNIQTALRIITKANNGETAHTIKRNGKVIRKVPIGEYRGLKQDWKGVSKVLPAVTGTRAQETIDYVKKVTGYAEKFNRN